MHKITHRVQEAIQLLWFAPQMWSEMKWEALFCDSNIVPVLYGGVPEEAGICGAEPNITTSLSVFVKAIKEHTSHL